jgi:transposase
VDALGNPIRILLTGGQIADVTQGEALVAGIATQAVTADKGYDSDALVETIKKQGMLANIPPRSHRNHKREVDWHRYKARHLVECFFNRLKQFRRIATRYDKLACRFNAFLHLACAYIWLL